MPHFLPLNLQLGLGEVEIGWVFDLEKSNAWGFERPMKVCASFAQIVQKTNRHLNGGQGDRLVKPNENKWHPQISMFVIVDRD